MYIIIVLYNNIAIYLGLHNLTIKRRVVIVSGCNSLIHHYKIIQK